MPRVANGLRFDRASLQIAEMCSSRNTGIQFGAHPGAIRVLSIVNHADAGTYAEAIQLAKQTATVPDITATRQTGTLKYGFGINAEQEITKDIGVVCAPGMERREDRELCVHCH